MSQAKRAVRDLALSILVGAMCGCGDDTGSSGTGGTGGSGGAGGAGGAPLQDEYLLSDQELVPESGSYDPVGRAFHVGSRTKGSITRVAADGTESLFFDPPASSNLRTLGLAIDADARRLWVCVQDTQLESHAIWTFDLSTGALEVEFELATAAADATCNDVALDSGGVAYVSDSANPRVYRANVDGEVIETWADDPLLDSDVTGIFGGNGIAVTEDDQYVLLSKTILSTATPRLLRIERANPENISGITTTPEITMTADGMSFLDGDLYVAAPGAGPGSGEIFRLTSEDQWQTATIATSMQQAGTSTVRPAEGDLYGIYSDITPALLGQPVTPPFRIYRIDLASFE